MQKLLEAFIGFFLGFRRIGRKDAHKLLEDRVSIRGNIKRRGDRTMGLQGGSNAKVKLEPAQDVSGGNFQEVIPKSVESLKEPSSDGVTIPARRGEGRRRSVGAGSGVKRGN